MSDEKVPNEMPTAILNLMRDEARAAGDLGLVALCDQAALKVPAAVRECRARFIQMIEAEADRRRALGRGPKRRQDP